MRAHNYRGLDKISRFVLTPFLLVPLYYLPEPIGLVDNESELITYELKLPTKSGISTTNDGRHYPIVPKQPIQLAQLLVEVEKTLRSGDTSPEYLPRLGHQQQVIYRVLSTDSLLAKKVLTRLPRYWSKVARSHLSARHEFLAMGKNSLKPQKMPAWKIIRPEPAKSLLSYYQKAEAETGIDWEVLAAINLVETGMGRISGKSIANAQGPMQFLPTTWDLPGVGMGGDINDPHDAIQAAARYLVIRGGLEDISKGLWGYNNSDYYGRAVLQYVQILKNDPSAFLGLYHWEIHYRVDAGDLWLAVGYSQEKSIPISTYLKEFPASLPPDYALND